jgi:hypothetical protein
VLPARLNLGTLALALCLGSLSATAPAHAAGKALAAPADEAPAVAQSEPAAPPAGKPAPVIAIVPRVSPEERARREREEARRRERARPRVAAWARAYRPAVAPLRAALDEALGSLAIAWGPMSHNLGYPLEVAIEDFHKRGLLPAPDPELDRRLRQALRYLKEGAAACQRRQPTVAQMRLYEGKGWLDLAEVVVRGYGVEPGR